jgi:glycosyltransferase involved in cell wall biosynthesis
MVYQGKRVVAVSAGLGKVLTDILAKHQVSVAQQTVIYNAMPISEIRASAHEKVTDLPPVPFILHVARLSPVKNQSLLLEAYAASGLTLPLVIIGEGSEGLNLRNLASRLGIVDQVLFLGQKHNPYPYMAQATAVVLSSNQEGLGLVLIEALACGTQTVATDVPGGIREVMIDELQRLLAEKSVSGLAEKLREAVNMPVVVRSEWADRFDLAQIVPQFLQLTTMSKQVKE